jgi:hypothetical protein
VKKIHEAPETMVEVKKIHEAPETMVKVKKIHEAPETMVEGFTSSHGDGSALKDQNLTTMMMMMTSSLYTGMESINIPLRYHVTFRNFEVTTTNHQPFSCNTRKLQHNTRFTRRLILLHFHLLPSFMSSKSAICRDWHGTPQIVSHRRRNLSAQLNDAIGCCDGVGSIILSYSGCPGSNLGSEIASHLS